MTDDTAATCEVVMRWASRAVAEWRADDVEFCGKVAVRRYPDSSGGFMYLCLEHGKRHEKYAELCYP